MFGFVDLFFRFVIHVPSLVFDLSLSIEVEANHCPLEAYIQLDPWFFVVDNGSFVLPPQRDHIGSRLSPNPNLTNLWTPLLSFMAMEEVSTQDTLYDLWYGTDFKPR